MTLQESMNTKYGARWRVLMNLAKKKHSSAAVEMRRLQSNQKSTFWGTAVAVVGALDDDPYLYASGLASREAAQRHNAVERVRVQGKIQANRAAVPQKQSAAMLRTMIRGGETELDAQIIHPHTILGHFTAKVRDAQLSEKEILGVITVKSPMGGPFNYLVFFNETTGFWNVDFDSRP